MSDMTLLPSIIELFTGFRRGGRIARALATSVEAMVARGRFREKLADIL